MRRALLTLTVAILLFAGCAAPARMADVSKPTQDFTETAFGLMFNYRPDGTIAGVNGFDKQEEVKLPYALEGKLLAVHVSSFGQHVMLLIQGSHYVIVCNQFGQNCRKYYLPPPHP